MEIIRRAIKVGNSSGVLLPKKLLGAEVKIILIKRPVNNKRRIIKLLFNYLEEIESVFIINQSPLESIAISKKIKRIIKSNDIKITIVPKERIYKDYFNSEILKQKLESAIPILNKNFLEELKSKEFR